MSVQESGLSENVLEIVGVCPALRMFCHVGLLCLACASPLAMRYVLPNFCISVQYLHAQQRDCVECLSGCGTPHVKPREHWHPIHPKCLDIECHACQHGIALSATPASVITHSPIISGRPGVLVATRVRWQLIDP